VIKRWRGEEEEAGSKERTGCMVIEKQKQNLAVSLVSLRKTTDLDAPRTHAVKTDQPAHARLVDLASDLGESRSRRVGRTVRTGRGDLSVDSGQEGGEGGEGGKGRHEHLEKSCFSCFFVCRVDVKGVV
jgi:hypothetical protein